jgi:CelD/BcsL family acetyltransferase involved in cellulose biosynthesis
MTTATPREFRDSAFAPAKHVADTIDPCAHGAWDRLVRDAQLGSVFHSSPWLSSIADTYGFTIKASSLSDASGDLRGAMPYVVVDDERGVRTRALPFSDYCDPIADESTSFLELVQPLLELELPLSLRVLHDSWARQSEIFDETGVAMWHGAHIGDDADAAWAGLKGSSRRNIRHAREAGVRIRVSSALDDVLRFHELHCALRKRKYRMLAQPRAFFESLHRHFAPHDFIHVALAELDGEVVAGTLYLEWGKTLYYKFNASTDTTARPNDLLMWAGMELARQRGLTFLDFGLSDCDQPGLIRFKTKFADVEARISTLTWLPDDAPREAQFGSVLKEITEVLTDPSVPDALTARAGDLLYRYFA